MEFFINRYGQRFDYCKTTSVNHLPAPHVHPGFELYICLETFPRECMLNSQHIPIRMPCAILYSPYSVHFNSATNNQTVYTRYSIYFGKDFLMRYDSCLNDLPVLQNKNSYIYLLDEKFSDEIKRLLDLMDVTAIRSRRQELLLVYLLRHLYHYDISGNTSLENVIKIQSPSYIPEVIQYIVDHIGEPLRIADIAGHFFISVNKLNQDFKQFTGVAVHQFIIHVKLSIAKYELRKRNSSIQNIARMMGFENEIYFFSFFKKKTGMTPSQWAKSSDAHSGDL